MEKVKIADCIVSGVNVGASIRPNAAANINSVDLSDNSFTISDAGTSMGMNILKNGTGTIKRIRANDNDVYGNPDHGYRKQNLGGGAINHTILAGNDLSAAATPVTIVATNRINANNATT